MYTLYPLSERLADRLAGQLLCLTMREQHLGCSSEDSANRTSQCLTVGERKALAGRDELEKFMHIVPRKFWPLLKCGSSNKAHTYGTCMLRTTLKKETEV